MIATVRRILDYVTLAISVVGGIAVFSGVLILVGSVAMTKYQRRYETAIFQTLGATRRSLVDDARRRVRHAGRPRRRRGIGGRPRA